MPLRLIPQADPCCRDSSGRTPYDMALCCDHQDVMALLLAQERTLTALAAAEHLKAQFAAGPGAAAISQGGEHGGAARPELLPQVRGKVRAFSLGDDVWGHDRDDADADESTDVGVADGGASTIANFLDSVIVDAAAFADDGSESDSDADNGWW